MDAVKKKTGKKGKKGKKNMISRAESFLKRQRMFPFSHFHPPL
jgi:hypothetical protein